jgi:hypothetical protein
MPENPAADWQGLSEHYRSMYDEELENLAAEFDDLTETAKQVLRNELSSRGLPPPGTKPAAPKSRPAVQPGTGSSEPLRWSGGFDALGGMIQSPGPSRSFDANDEGSSSSEFTWKTLLCECDTTEQAQQIREMLKRAGIESWIEQPGTRWSVSSPRVVVAADQLEDAIELARRPIPQEIVDEIKTEMPEYEPPQCPDCGADDPVLESAEPTNSWLCEACGAQWQEPEIAAADAAG